MKAREAYLIKTANYDSDPEYQRLVGEYHINRVNHLRSFRQKMHNYMKSKATASDAVSTQNKAPNQGAK